MPSQDPPQAEVTSASGAASDTNENTVSGPSNTPEPAAPTDTRAKAVPPVRPRSAPGLPVVPGYEVLREIARGGMGVVYAAHDPVFGREVAVKVMHPGQNAGRFVIEAKVTAQLPHPGVPPVYALGELPDGRPFLVMKLVEGGTLAKELETPDPARHLGAFEQICQTVGFAHARGIVHRDLKPANVMVGSFGEVQVMDWGLAKYVGSDDAQHPEPGGLWEVPPPKPGVEETVAGQVKGTPAYMAPEQARGEPVGPPADVFALGGVLAVILTGKPPFLGNSVLDTVLKAAQAELSECLAQLDSSGADPELIAIAKQCLAPTADARYGNGRAVAEAVAAHRAGVEERLRDSERDRAAAEARADEAVNTRREAQARVRAERARVAEQRKRRNVQLIALGAVAVVLVVGAGLATWQWRVAVAETDRATEQTRVAARERDSKEDALDEAQRQRDAARTAEERAREDRDAAQNAEQRAREDRDAAREAEQRAERDRDAARTAEQRAQVERAAAADARSAAEKDRDAVREALRQMEAAQYLRFVADARRGLRDRRPDLAREALFQTAEGLRGWEWHHLARALDAGVPARLFGTSDYVPQLTFSPNGHHLVVPGWALEAPALWDTRTATRLFRLNGLPSSSGRFRFSTDGQLVLAHSAVYLDGGKRREGSIKGWTVPGGELAFTLPVGDGEGRVLDFASNGKDIIAFGSPTGDKGGVIWDARAGTVLTTLEGLGTAGYSVLSPDGALLAVGNSPNQTSVELRDGRTGEVKQTLSGFKTWVTKPVFCPDGSRLAVVTNSQSHPMQLKVFDAAGRALAAVEEPNGTAFESVGFSRDGGRLAVAVWRERYKPGARCELKVLDAVTGAVLFRQDVNPDLEPYLAISPDGKRVAVGRHPDAVDRRIEIRVTDLATSKEVFSTATPEGRISALTFTPDGNRVACVYAAVASGYTPPGTVLIWELSKQPGELPPLTFAGHRSPVLSVGISPDGTRLAAGAQDGSVRVWPVSDPGAPAVFADHTRPVTGVVFHPDGKRFASAGEKEVNLWELDRPQPVRALTIGNHAPVAVAFRADGNVLASAGRDATVRLWDPATGRHLVALEWPDAAAPTGGFASVAFAPKGTVLAAGANGGDNSANAAPVILWDTETRKVIGRFAGHRGAVTAVAFNPTMTAVATGGSDRIVKIWDIETKKLLRQLSGHTGPVTGVVFGDGGRRVFSASADRTVRVWDAATGQELLVLDAGGPCGGVALGAGGLLATGAGTAVRGWDGSAGREVFALPRRPSPALALAVQPNGGALALTTADRRDPVSHNTVEPGTVEVWDIAPTRSRFVVGNAEVYRLAPVAFTDGGGLAVAAWDQTRKGINLMFLDAVGDAVLTLPPPRGNSTDIQHIRALALSPNGKVLAVGGGPYDFRRPGVVELRDARTGRLFQRLEGLRGGVNAVAFAPDGRTLAAGCTDFTVALWEIPDAPPPPPAERTDPVPTKQPRSVLTGHKARVRAVAFDHDGKRVAAGAEDGAIRLWDAGDGTELPIAFRGHDGSVEALAFAPGGRALATGGADGVVAVWEAASGKRTLVLAGHHDSIRGLVYAPDGTRIYTAGQDGYVKGWDVRPR